VLPVGGRLQLERGVLDVEVVGQAVAEPVEHPRAVRAGSQDDVHRQDVHAAGDGPGVEVVTAGHALGVQDVPADLVQLMREYARAGDDLAADPRLAREKTTGAAWQTVAGGSRLAGEIARNIASEADLLKTGFQQLLVDGAVQRQQTGESSTRGAAS